MEMLEMISVLTIEDIKKLKTTFIIQQNVELLKIPIQSIHTPS